MNKNNENKQTDYTVQELFAELVADPSWEPNAETRQALSFGLLVTLMIL